MTMCASESEIIATVDTLDGMLRQIVRVAKCDDKVMREFVPWRSPQTKAARRRLMDSYPMIFVQTTINAGFDLRR
jgi:hypothetical protein